MLLDFGGLHSKFKDQAKYYRDLSESSSTEEAINNIYEALRWAETRTDAKSVLITDLLSYSKKIEAKTSEDNMEHLDALYDRIFRATSGTSAS